MSSVPAAEQTLAILRYLAGQANPVPAGAIARGLGIPRSTTYHLLSTMTASRFVVHYPEQRAYGLGLTAYELGSGYVRQAPLQRLARQPMAALSDACGHTAHLTVLMGREVVYVIEERAAGHAMLITDVGVRLAAHGTASGRAMLASLPTQQVRALYADRAAFATKPGSRIGSLSALRRLLIDVRRDGFAREDGEVTPGLSSIAVAVTDPVGYPLAAVAVTFAAETTSAEAVREILGHVRETAALLRQRLTGQSVLP